MSETSTPSLVFESFLEFIKNIAWCKQGEDVLVAVQACTAEIIVALSDKEAKVYPGGTPIKINKSWLSTLQEKNAEGTPIPLLIVWKSNCLEVWYRRQKSHDFPYDTWQSALADAHEKECVRMPAELGGEKFTKYHQELLAKAKLCPSVIPAL
ncbi:MAG: hypothetical protein K2X27_12005 [Candidatus Obscuribacterales bacterium]|nr:hypothetical protein [Candidatus Obscuribacterales bacterium]